MELFCSYQVEYITLACWTFSYSYLIEACTKVLIWILCYTIFSLLTLRQGTMSFMIVLIQWEFGHLLVYGEDLMIITIFWVLWNFIFRKN